MGTFAWPTSLDSSIDGHASSSHDHSIQQSLEVSLHPTSATSASTSASSRSPSSYRRSGSISSSTGGAATKLDALMPFGGDDSKRHTMASVNTTLSAPELHSSPESDDGLDYDPAPPRPSSMGSRRSQRFNSTGSATSSTGKHRRETTPAWKTRHKCTPEQQRQLLAFFDHNCNPKGKVRQELADQLGMPERSVQIWFQNK